MLRIENLSVSYGYIRALWDVSLEVGEGESVALVGANGAGKSTLLKALMGLLPAQSGRVLVDGVPTNSARPHEMVDLGIAYVPEGRRIFPYLTVEENLLMGAYTKRARSEKSASLQAVYALFPVLKQRHRQIANTLSGGEQQMLSIGRALMGRPRLLLLDEPSFGLAPIVLTKVFETLGEIHRRGVAILVAEQNVREALTITERAYVVEGGRIILAGPSTELLSDERVKTAYLGA